MIYVLGSLNVDFVANTRVPKKGETVLADGFAMFCGGKGANQAAAIAKLGGAVSMIGHVGNDEFGGNMTDNLKSLGVDTTHITKKDERSGLAMIWVSGGDNRIVVWGGANARFEKDEIDIALSGAAAGDILLAQLEIPPDIVAYAFSVAKRNGMTTILNPAPACDLPPELFYHTDIITPNETETVRLTGVNPIDTVHIALAVKQLYQMGIGSVVITLGARGSAVAVGQTITEIPAKKVKIVDTTGAGDTFVGAVAERLSCGADLVSACYFATAAASVTVQRAGAIVSVPTREEVLKVYKR